MPKADRPNVILFFADQQRWDTCGCYGQELPVTPHLDRMAAEGVRFELAFTCQPVCGPARACIQTGKYATEVGCFRNHTALPLGETTIATLASAHGYETAYVGKWHLASDEAHDFREKPVPLERRGGWKDFWVASDVLEFTSHPFEGHLYNGAGERVDFGGYRVDRVTDFALDFLRARDRSRPLFMMISHIEPHHQNDLNRYVGPRGSRERFADYRVPGDLEGTDGNEAPSLRSGRQSADWRENYGDYLGCCSSLDANLGRLRAELERLGMAEDTVVVYTADHGSHFRTRNSEYKRACHDGCIRIPLVACGPGFRGGRVVSDDLVSLIDVPPTLVAAAGIAPPASMRGRPLQEFVGQTFLSVPTATGRIAGPTTAPWPQEVFLQISESEVGRAIRTKRWKYSIVAPGADGWKQPAAERCVEDYLYDLECDPHERNNLVREPSLERVRSELAARLSARMKEAGELEPRIDGTAHP